jgi:hypothetical protein
MMTESDGGPASYLGDSSSGMYFWGLQLESATDYVTSYVPTAGATVTRSADSYTLPGVTTAGVTLHL